MLEIWTTKNIYGMFLYTPCYSSFAGLFPYLLHWLLKNIIILYTQGLVQALGFPYLLYFLFAHCLCSGRYIPTRKNNVYGRFVCWFSILLILLHWFYWTILKKTRKIARSWLLPTNAPTFRTKISRLWVKRMQGKEKWRTTSGPTYRLYLNCWKVNALTMPKNFFQSWMCAKVSGFCLSTAITLL